MKRLAAILTLGLLSTCLLSSEEESPELTILEALKIALREIPEGKSVSSIEHVQIDETKSIYYAVYDEAITPYQRNELNADGEYVEVTKYRKENVAIEIASKDTYRIGVLASERSRPSISTGDRRILPRRRVISE